MPWWSGNKAPAVGDVAETATAKPEADKPAVQQTVDLSVIDFGKAEPAGDMMAGFCAQGDPGEIQACIWKVDTAANGKRTVAGDARIHIEF
mmetsp:Transcript_47867/g.122157  ORF Transcript_47867/g.122157 Transcript_47867/m.122157 type:complete len:91 (-) Transcript_47867:95-367(-)